MFTLQTLTLSSCTLDRFASLSQWPQADPFSHTSRAGGPTGFASERIRVNEQTPADGLSGSEAAERIGMLPPAESFGNQCEAHEIWNRVILVWSPFV